MSETFPETVDILPEHPQFTVNIGGLGILSVNTEEDRAEIGYIDVAGHNAGMAIVRLNNGEIVEELYPFTRIKRKTIEIESGQGGAGAQYLGAEASKNISNVISLDDTYGAATTLKPFDGMDYQARVYIRGLIFYSDPAKVASVRAYEFADPDREVFVRDVALGIEGIPRSGDTLKSIKIDGENIEAGGNSIVFDPESEYHIYVNTGCPPGNSDSDFKHYYDYLEGATKPKYNLEYFYDDISAGLNHFETAWLSPVFDRLRFRKQSPYWAGAEHSVLSDRIRTLVENIDELSFDDDDGRLFLLNRMESSLEFLCGPQPCGPCRNP